MNTQSALDVRTTAISANLAALHRLLTRAMTMTAEGCERIHQGERNGAIGAVLNIDAILDEAKAIYAATLALHRSKSI